MAFVVYGAEKRLLKYKLSKDEAITHKQLCYPRLLVNDSSNKAEASSSTSFLALKFDFIQKSSLYKNPNSCLQVTQKNLSYKCVEIIISVTNMYVCLYKHRVASNTDTGSGHIELILWSTAYCLTCRWDQQKSHRVLQCINVAGINIHRIS